MVPCWEPTNAVSGQPALPLNKQTHTKTSFPVYIKPESDIISSPVFLFFVILLNNSQIINKKPQFLNNQFIIFVTQIFYV